jgi:syntenin-1
MSSLYPTLEDMKVDQIQKAQLATAQSIHNQQQGSSPYPPSAVAFQSADLAMVYPSLMDEYMGLRLEPPTGPLAVRPMPTQQQVAVPSSMGYSQMIAPVTGNDVGIRRANVTHGVREVICCKDAKNKVGLRLKDVNKGVFVQFVQKDSPAALAGLRFGDQLLQICGQNAAGLSGDKAMKLMEKADAQRVTFAVRDRPFERAITLHKDSSGHCGFTHDDGMIKAIVKDSSAARNGLLIDHNILEVNGQNVIGLKSKELAEIISKQGQVITLTIMPKQLYEHMVKCMSDSLVKKNMDHSIPEFY